MSCSSMTTIWPRGDESFLLSMNSLLHSDYPSTILLISHTRPHWTHISHFAKSMIFPLNQLNKCLASLLFTSPPTSNQTLSTHIYLSGICNQLEVYFPDIWKNHNSILVSHTLAGCHQHFGTAIQRKRPLSTDALITVLSQFNSPPWRKIVSCYSIHGFPWAFLPWWAHFSW